MTPLVISSTALHISADASESHSRVNHANPFCIVSGCGLCSTSVVHWPISLGEMNHGSCPQSLLPPQMCHLWVSPPVSVVQTSQCFHLPPQARSCREVKPHFYLPPQICDLTSFPGSLMLLPYVSPPELSEWLLSWGGCRDLVLYLRWRACNRQTRLSG